MSRWRLRLACGVCRLSHALLRLCGRGGTSLPGKLAQRICPDILTRLAQGRQIVLVSGTNGKTTTAALLRHMARAQGIPCAANASGANLPGGITAALASAAREDMTAVLECDEAALAAVAAQLHPAVIVVTNLFRDQLDRYGEITATREKLLAGLLRAPEAVVCLNADCSLTATLAQEIPNRVLFFGVDAALDAGESAVSDAPRCLRCGGEYRYTRRSFAHLGDWSCPRCALRRPHPDFSAAQVLPIPGRGSRVEITHAGASRWWELALPASYNVYNALAALSAAAALGWDAQACAAALATAAAPFGRMESFQLRGVPVQLMLAKNPAGLDRVLEYLSALPGTYYPIFCLNDRAADGTDVSWIWDADLERFAGHAAFSRAGVWGRRREDMRVRLKYAGLDDARIDRCAGTRALCRRIAESRVPVYIAANYTAMLAVRAGLAAAAGKRRLGGEKWS